MRRILLIVSLLCLSVPSCKTGQGTWDNIVTDVTTAIDCTKATCAEAGPVCAQITAEVLACVPELFSGSPGPACAALLNFSVGRVAFADVVCIVDAFTDTAPDNALAKRYQSTANTSAPTLAESQAAARGWLAGQGIGVIRVKASRVDSRKQALMGVDTGDL